MERTSPRARPRFAPWTTPLYAALWLAVVVQGWSPLLDRDPVVWLRYPDATAERMTERDLELAEAVARDAGPLRPLLDRLYGPPEEARGYAIEIHRDLLDREELPAARHRLAILLLEAGGEEDLAEVRRLLGDDTILDTDDLRDLGLSAAWVERAARVFATIRGDPEERAEAEGALAARSERWKWRSLALAVTNLGLVALGAVLLATRLGRARILPGGAATPPPWCLADGFGVFVRGDFWNRSFFLFLAWLGSEPAGFALAETQLGAWIETLLYGWGTLFASLPLLWLIHRHLLRPAGLGFAGTFGLRAGPARWAQLAVVALCATAIDLVGTHAIGWTAWGAGVGSSWAEGFDEALVWGNAGEAALTTLDYVAWTPVFEELAFRGVLYFSLRARLPAMSAACVTSVFFALLHFYSLPGFAMTLWSGFVWALAFERTRSLVPGVAAHAVYNALFVAGLLLLYR